MIKLLVPKEFGRTAVVVMVVIAVYLVNLYKQNRKNIDIEVTKDII